MLKVLSINDFIKFVKNEPNKWINYCEVLLDEMGRVILCDGSHSTTAVEYAASKDNKTIEEISQEIREDYCDPLEWVVDKYGIIAIWYYGYTHGKSINRLQKRSMEILRKNGIVCKEEQCLFKRESREYRNYLFRKETFNR